MPKTSTRSVGHHELLTLTKRWLHRKGEYEAELAAYQSVRAACFPVGGPSANADRVVAAARNLRVASRLLAEAIDRHGGWPHVSQDLGKLAVKLKRDPRAARVANADIFEVVRSGRDPQLAYGSSLLRASIVRDIDIIRREIAEEAVPHGDVPVPVGTDEPSRSAASHRNMEKRGSNSAHSPIARPVSKRRGGRPRNPESMRERVAKFLARADAAFTTSEIPDAMQKAGNHVPLKNLSSALSWIVKVYPEKVARWTDPDGHVLYGPAHLEPAPDS